MRSGPGGDGAAVCPLVCNQEEKEEEELLKGKQHQRNACPRVCNKKKREKKNLLKGTAHGQKGCYTGPSTVVETGDKGIGSGKQGIGNGK